MSVKTTSAPQQAVNMPAVDLRQLFGSLISTEGLRTTTDLQVAQRGSGANMSVDVSAGSCVIQDDHGSGGGFYAYTLNATQNVPITAADGTNPRIDRIVVQIDDTFQGDGDNLMNVKVITGTPTGGATLVNLSGAASVPGSTLLLANVLIPAGSTSVITANIGNVAAVLVGVGAGGPSGTLVPYAAAAAPTGYLLADGSAVSRTSFAALFAAIGTTYGVGNGSTTFNLPDMRGRMAVGYAASGGHTDVSTLGGNDGQAAANRRSKHQTSLVDPGHVHPGIPAPSSTDNGGAAVGNVSGTQNSGSAVTGITVGTGVANDAADTPSYLVLNYIIKT